MKKIAYWISVIFICAFALASIYISFILIIGSGFIMGNIDYNEAQRQSADTKAYFLSLFGFFSLCISVAILFLSSHIAHLALKIFGMNDKTK